MAKPFIHDLTGDRAIFRGQTFRDRVTYSTRENEQAPEVPVDLSGATAVAQFRRSVNAEGAPLLELSTANGGITLGGAAGTVEMHITAAQTAAIEWTAAVYQMEITFANGDVRRLLQGDVEVDPEVVRP